jgi:hypothetical protein
MDFQIEATLKSVLLPEEQILWTGTPDLVYRKWRRFRRDVTLVAGTILLGSGALHMAVVLDHPDMSPFNLSGTIQFALIISILPAIYIVLVWLQQKRADEALRAQPPGIFFVLTNQRVLAHYPFFLTTISRSLADVHVNLKPLSKGFGTILFHIKQQPATPVQDTTPSLSYDFFDIANAAEVYSLIVAAQNQIIQSTTSTAS